MTREEVEKLLADERTRDKPNEGIVTACEVALRVVTKTTEPDKPLERGRFWWVDHD